MWQRGNLNAMLWGITFIFPKVTEGRKNRCLYTVVWPFFCVELTGNRLYTVMYIFKSGYKIRGQIAVKRRGLRFFKKSSK